jgi:hypothetical protein
MKKLGIFFLLFLLLSPVYLFAQDIAKIIDLQGRVFVKKKPDAPWQKAKINQLLEKESELKTEKKSLCTLAFDEELKNILTIKENSHIKIENIKPGNIFLPEGRVFVLIQSLAKAEKFQIRTPTAIAGSRGTGWRTDYHHGNTSNACFQDQIYLQGLDEEGNVTDEEDLFSGWGRNVGEGGVFDDPFQLGGTDYDEWNDFMGYIDELTGEGEDTDYLEELRQDQEEDYGNMGGESRRRDEETKPTGGGEIEYRPE